MAITAEQVRDLRDRTGAGMMDCKRALEETGGDFDQAIALLREKGLATAQKKAGRVASEGLVDAFVAADRLTGALVEINSETDFVANNPEFRGFVRQVAQAAAGGQSLGETSTDAGETLSGLKLGNGETVGSTLTALIGKIGENMSVRRYARFAVAGGKGLVESYIHMGGRIGVLIELSLDNAALAGEQEILSLARDLAMQVAAARPEYVNRNEVPVEVIERERAIYKAQAVNEGKPEQVAEKIVVGRLDKFFKEVCLLEQAYIKDPNQNCTQLLQGISAKSGCAISVKRFARFERGEGLAKRTEDFAAEVQAQLNK